MGMMKPLSLIIAVDETGGFSKDGKIPWHFSEDLKHFKLITSRNACIMGRNTYQDIYDMIIARKLKNSKKDKPVKIEEILPGRECYVISHTLKNVEGATVVPNIRKAVESTKKNKIFIIGGERVYNESLPWVNRVYMSIIKGEYGCDRFFPVNYIYKNFNIVGGKKGSDSLLFVEYRRK
jgi:dihydrofolate reductase